MSTTTPRGLIEVTYYQAAQDYLRSLPPEHFMEAVGHATQRKITVASMDLVQVQRPDVQTFNELLVQYPRPGKKSPGQVVPDNMTVVHPDPLSVDTSFDVPLQPARPFLVMEYVSKKSKRKDYEDNFDRYEKELAVPYYLLFYPDTQDLTLYRHTGKKYVSVKPNGHGRHPIPDLELEVALLDGWVRYWFRGELLPLPAELLRELTEVRRELMETQQRLEQAEQQRDQTRQRLEQAEQQRDQAQQQRDQAQQELDELRQRMERVEQELARLGAKKNRTRKKPSSGS